TILVCSRAAESREGNLQRSNRFAHFLVFSFSYLLLNSRRSGKVVDVSSELFLSRGVHVSFLAGRQLLRNGGEEPISAPKPDSEEIAKRSERSCTHDNTDYIICQGGTCR